MRILLESFISSFPLLSRARVCRANFHLPLVISTRQPRTMENTTVAEKDEFDKVDVRKAKAQAKEEDGKKLAQAKEEDGKKLAQEIEKKLTKEMGSPPEKPLPGDCCGSGCETCVWDIYYDQLRDYNKEKDALLKSLTSSKP